MCSGLCTGAFIIPGREGTRSQGTRTIGEQSHETCGQDYVPDGRFGLRVRGSCYPDGSSSRRRTHATVQTHDRLPSVNQQSEVNHEYSKLGVDDCVSNFSPLFYFPLLAKPFVILPDSRSAAGK